MKKKLSVLLAVVLTLSMVLGLAGCGKEETPDAGNQGQTSGQDTNKNDGTGSSNAAAELAGTYDITVWVSEVDGVKELTAKQINDFCAENPGIVINATIEGVSEADSATQMITSVEDGADIYCFAQDQLARLVMAGALNPLGKQASATVTELNDAGAVGAATVGDALYCYPLTSDNGYFMYYDKSVIKESSLDSLEAIIADCEAAGKLFSMELETSAWYNAAFFFATGCKSNWVTDLDGNFVSVDDDFNSANGVIALKGMQKLLKSKAYNSSSDGAQFAAAVPSAVVISGTWAADVVKSALGDNFAATDLPSFTVDGKSYHLGSYSGNKLLGVKPQLDAKRTAVLQRLALYLTGEKCQTERFNQFNWGPSNKAAQQTDAVKNDIALSALALQGAYAVPQCQIEGAWWDIAKVYAVSAKEANTDAELKAALATYEESIKGRLNVSVDEKMAWSIIGSINGDSWSVDIPMTLDNKGIWHSDVLTFKGGEEFKLRQGGGWDVNIGSDGQLNGPNFVVSDAGSFIINFVFDDSSKIGSVSLVDQDSVFGYTVIGTINGDSWTVDLPMALQADGSWLTTEAYNLVEGDEFKCRQGFGWDVCHGDGGNNFKVAAAGTYKIKLNADKTIELVK
ncbi:MAG: extracellular solute-binding protein [Lachnospiraceae bacterium]|nr:extracellular solute-binding protein [Lachnospiraceae bacterium]